MHCRAFFLLPIGGPCARVPHTSVATVLRHLCPPSFSHLIRRELVHPNVMGAPGLLLLLPPLPLLLLPAISLPLLLLTQLPLPLLLLLLPLPQTLPLPSVANEASPSGGSPSHPCSPSDSA